MFQWKQKYLETAGKTRVKHGLYIIFMTIYNTKYHQNLDHWKCKSIWCINNKRRYLYIKVIIIASTVIWIDLFNFV